MTNDKSVYNLPSVNYNVYWPIIGHLYCMTSFWTLYAVSFSLFLFYSWYQLLLKVSKLCGHFTKKDRWCPKVRAYLSGGFTKQQKNRQWFLNLTKTFGHARLQLLFISFCSQQLLFTKKVKLLAVKFLLYFQFHCIRD